jgi:hypothetical protein
MPYISVHAKRQEERVVTYSFSEDPTEDSWQLVEFVVSLIRDNIKDSGLRVVLATSIGSEWPVAVIRLGKDWFALPLDLEYYEAIVAICELVTRITGTKVEWEATGLDGDPYAMYVRFTHSSRSDVYKSTVNS